MEHVRRFIALFLCANVCVMDIGVGDGPVCVCHSNHQKKGHCKLNKVNFLFKVLEQRRRPWRRHQRWILMSYCICVGET